MHNETDYPELAGVTNAAKLNVGSKPEKMQKSKNINNMNNFWLEVAKTATFRANNNLEGMNQNCEICMKYDRERAILVQRLYAIASYCIERYYKNLPCN